MVKNGQKWSKMVKNGCNSIWPEMVKNGQKWSKMVKNGCNSIFLYDYIYSYINKGIYINKTQK